MDTDTIKRFRPMIPWKLITFLLVFITIMASLTVILSYAGLFPFNHPLGVYRILPGDILLDFAWIYAISILIGLVVYLALPTLSSLALKAHRISSGEDYKYYIQSLNPRTKQKGLTGRLLMPSLVSIGFSSTISSISSIVNLLFVSENFETLAPFTVQVLEVSMPFFFIHILLTSFIGILFAPFWLLEDTGIICERQSIDERVTADIEGVGNRYLAFLKGFAGISTIAAYLLISLDMIEWYQMLPGQIEIPLVFFLLPVMVIVLAPVLGAAPVAITFISYELSLEKNAEQLEINAQNEGLKHVTIELPRMLDTDAHPT
jgi:hypothetical protein